MESEALKYPVTRALLDRFKASTVVEVPSYSSVFSRPRQHFQTQKQSTNLILAVKKDKFLYKGSGQVQDPGLDNFYYNTLALNCLYNCDYCYLQGMYPSANVVVFVNLSDYFEATKEAVSLRENPEQPVYLCLSYDTDLLAFEGVVPYCREWIDFARRESDVLVEIRTKSSSYRAIRDLPATDRVILAWTLSPDSVVSRYEHGTPPLARRIASAADAVRDGWKVRLCFDPMLAIPEWQTAYSDLVESTFQTIPAEAVLEVTVGVFRISTGYFDTIKRQRQDSDLLFGKYTRVDGNVTYQDELRREMVNHMTDYLGRYLPDNRISIWV